MYDIFEELLHKHGITIYKFCKDTGISQSTIYTWKKKHSIVGTEIGIKICDYFGISMDYLMTGEEVAENKKPVIPPISERDISIKINEIIGDIHDTEGSPIYFDGIELDEKSKEIAANFFTALKQQMELVCEMNKKK
jgi:transcriptional regulator with XRE-family HTH domain